MAFNLPPGCSVRDIPGNGPEEPCEVCGGYADYEGKPAPCICPECPECGDYGNPECYQRHGLRRTMAQEAQLAEMERQRDAAEEMQYVHECTQLAKVFNEQPQETIPPELKAAIAEAERCVHVLSRAYAAGIKPTRTTQYLRELADKIANYTESWQSPI